MGKREKTRKQNDDRVIRFLTENPQRSHEACDIARAYPSMSTAQVKRSLARLLEAGRVEERVRVYGPFIKSTQYTVKEA